MGHEKIDISKRDLDVVLKFPKSDCGKKLSGCRKKTNKNKLLASIGTSGFVSIPLIIIENFENFMVDNEMVEITMVETEIPR